MLYIVILCTIVPFIIWKIGDAKRDRHQLLASLVFDKFRGEVRFVEACKNALLLNVEDIDQDKFETAVKDWQKSFRLQAAAFLQQKYSASQLSTMLAAIKTVEGEKALTEIVPGFSSHIDMIANENAMNLLSRLKPNSKDDVQVMGRRRRRR